MGWGRSFLKSMKNLFFLFLFPSTLPQPTGRNFTSSHSDEKLTIYLDGSEALPCLALAESLGIRYHFDDADADLPTVHRLPLAQGLQA